MKNDLCKYSDLFGAPNTGPHRYRFLGKVFNGGIAIVDVVATILLGIFIKTFFFKNTNILKIMSFLFVLGIIAHRVFCVKTTIDIMLFGN
jgi:hypothetical protein